MRQKQVTRAVVLLAVALALVTTSFALSTGTTMFFNIEDTIAPTVLNQSATTTNQSVTIDTMTDEAANLTIQWGTTPALGSYAYDASHVMNHSTLLSVGDGIINGTLYYYNITVCDVTANCRTYGPFNATTLQNVDLVPPVITNVTIRPTNDTAPFNVTTDEPSNTSIACTPAATAIAASYATTHSLTLTPLVNGTSYSCNVTACDMFNNCVTNGPYNFSTQQNTDTIAPVIVTRVDGATNQSGTINVTISEPANVTIQYGTTPTLGSTATNATFASTANMTLPGLQNGTTYFYNITACDSSGNCAEYGVYYFTTLQNVDVVPPVVTNVTLSPPTNQSEVINVTTDEPTNATLNCTPAASATDASYAAMHSLLLSPLVNNTQYSCTLRACDAFHNCNVSGPYVFTTLNNTGVPPDVTPPTIITRVDGTTNQSGTVNITVSEPANVTIRYGTTTTLGGGSAVNVSYATTANMTINGLVNGTLYYYNVTVCDVSDNCANYGPYTFTTLQNTGDSTPPVQQNVSIVPTNQSATLNVTTNEGANTTVVCSPAASATALTYTTTHSLLLSPLVNNTQYACNVTSCDVFDNCVTSGPYVFTTLQNVGDVTPPFIIAQTPYPTNQSAVINVTFNEPANITIRYGATIFFGGNAYNTSFVINQSVFLGPLVNNTLYYYNVTACDASGNCQTIGIQTFTTLQNGDTVPPFTQNVTITPTNGTATLNITTDEPTNTSVVCTPAASATALTYTTTHSLLLSPLVNNTLYACNVTACDPFGNCNTTGEYNFTTLQNTDNAPPIVITHLAGPTNESAIVNITLNEPANITIRYGTTITLGSTAYNTSFAFNQSIFLGPLLNNTLYYYNITACDSTGNCQTTGIHSFTTLQNNDTVPPVTINVTIMPITNQSATINVTTDEQANTSVVCAPPASATAATYVKKHSIVLSPLVNGTLYACNITACDKYGNCDTTGEYNFTTLQNIDNIPPLEVSHVDSATNQSALVNITFNEPANITINYGTSTFLGTKVYNTSYLVNQSVFLAPLINGTIYYYNITACDIFGNCKTTGPHVFVTLQNMDTIAPVVQNVTIKPTNQTATVNVTTDEPANTSIACAPTASASSASYTVTHNLLLSPLVNNTLYLCNITACDAYGNCNTGDYNFTTLQNTDTVPPQLLINLAGPTNQSAIVNITFDEAANVTIRYGATTFLGSVGVDTGFTVNHSVFLGPLVNNTLYYYNITACDAYGNCQTTGVHTFTTLQNLGDTTSPVILTRNDGATNHSGTVNITISELANVTITYGTTPTLGGSVTNASYATTANMTINGLLNGTLYYYNITACDPSGNCVMQGPYTFTTLQNVDTLPPIQQNVSITPTNDTATLNVTTDEGANTTVVCSPSASATAITYTTTHSLLLSPLVNNTQYACNVTSCDTFDNCVTSGPYVFTTLQNTDNVPPQVITNLAGPTNQSAIVNITLDEPANITIYYGTTTTLGSVGLDTGFTVNHSVFLGPLVNNTLYYYNITACDIYGNCKTTGVYTFTTLQNNDTVPPRITNVTITPVTNQSATINVTTDEQSNKSIVCTPTASATATTYVKKHSILLSPLVNGTQYSCNITACDRYLNCNVSGPYVFTTLNNGPAPDLTPPVIITRVDGATNQTGTINITIDEPANVTIRYGTTTTLTGGNVVNTSYATTANTTINGLLNGTLYYYNITVCDVYDNCASYGPYSFTTLQNVDTLPPIQQNVSITPRNDTATLNVTTDEGANTTVVCSPAASATALTYVTTHSLLLSPLVNNTQYACNVTSCDAYDNCATSGPYTFTTSQNLDTIPPVLINQTATPTNQSSVLITTYNEAANVTIRYGTTSALGSTAVNLTYTTTHSILLSGLQNGTLYYYNITVCDVYDNCASYGPYSFTTLQNMDVLPPIQQNVSIAPTNDTATLNVTTDEGANTTVVCSPSASATALTYTTTHSLLLSPLINNTQYACNVTSCDVYDNCVTSGPYVFTTLQNGDTIAPMLINQTATPTNETSAVITTYNEAANVTIAYGTTTTLGSVAVNLTYTTTHDILLTGLVNNTLYYYNITICDSSDNCVTNGTFSFTTPQNVDLIPPIITNVTITPTNDSAPFVVSTNEPTNTTIVCSPPASAAATGYALTHSLTVSPLVNNTQYSCNVTACDGSDNCVTSGPHVFTTLQNVDNVAPIILTRVDGATNQSATINVTINEPANVTITYGTTPTLGSTEVYTSYATFANMLLLSLTNGTLYYYNITACDVFGNCVTEGPYTFTTLQNLDLTPPVQIDVNIVPTNDSATINVTTDEGANTTIVCSPTASATATSYMTMHTLLLSPLINNTQYACNVTSCDVYDNCVTSGPDVFTTLQNTGAPPDTTPPTIITRVDGATNQSGTINITIDEPANVTINYGTTTTLGGSVVNVSYATTANMTIDGLLNGTLYYYNVTVCDVYDNCASYGPFSFTTLQNVDVLPPIQQNVSIAPTNDTAQLNVTTDEGANTTVICSPSASATATSYATEHSLLLSPLVNNTQYACNVTSCDIFDNCVTSGPYVFTTDQNAGPAADTTPPTVTLLRPLNNTNISASTWKFNFSATDDNATALTCILRFNSTSYSVNATSGVPASRTLTGLTNGTYWWNVSCSDGNNTGTSATWVVIINITNVVHHGGPGGPTGPTEPISNITPPHCTPNWLCSDVGDCVNGMQQRDCIDFNSCNNVSGRPALSVPCTPVVPPQPPTPPVTPGQPGGETGGPLIQPEVVAPGVPTQQVGIIIPAEVIGILIAILALSLLILTTGAVVLLARRKEEAEAFYGVELEKDTTYVHYDLVVEALTVLEKLLDGQPVDDHTPFVQDVCNAALEKAQANIATAKIPRERLDGHVDWLSAELYSRVVDMLAAALVADVPFTITDDGHMHVVTVPGVGGPAESYVDLSIPLLKMPITPIIVQQRGDVQKVLAALRESETVLLLDIRYTEDELKRFMKAVKKTVQTHNGAMLAVGDGKYLVTSGIPIDTSSYVQPQDDAP